MHKVKALEWMVLFEEQISARRLACGVSIVSTHFLDSSEHVDTALLAGVSLNRCRWVHDVEFLLVGCDRQVRDWNHANNREQSSLWLPAFRATAGVVVSDIAGQCDSYAVLRAVAFECSTRKVRVTLLDTIVDEGVD